MLLNCWGIQAEDPEIKLFSQSLQQELLQADGPLYNVLNDRYDQLLIFSMRNSYYGMKNEYLSNLASEILNKPIIVKGQPEKLFACPCCEYETLQERGEYDICPMCFWEDTGSDDLHKYSGPNHMTLGEAKNNYKKYGVMNKGFVQYIYSENVQIYFKGTK